MPVNATTAERRKAGVKEPVRSAISPAMGGARAWPIPMKTMVKPRAAGAMRAPTASPTAAEMMEGIDQPDKPKRIVDETWRPDLAYAVGLIATDGCLSNNGLLVDLTSNDREQLKNYSKCLGISFKIGQKSNGGGGKSLRVQFKNRIFYNFLSAMF